MGYTCYATNEYVEGETRELIPIQIRKVKYYNNVKRPNGPMYFNKATEGWEIVKEVPVRASKAEEFAAKNPPEIVGEKEITTLTILTRKREDYKPRKNEEDGSDKPETEVDLELKKVEVVNEQPEQHTDI